MHCQVILICKSYILFWNGNINADQQILLIYSNFSDLLYIVLKLLGLLFGIFSWMKQFLIKQQLLNQGTSKRLNYRMLWSITPVGMEFGKIVATPVPLQCCYFSAAVFSHGHAILISNAPRQPPINKWRSQKGRLQVSQLSFSHLCNLPRVSVLQSTCISHISFSTHAITPYALPNLPGISYAPPPPSWFV